MVEESLRVIIKLRHNRQIHVREYIRILAPSRDRTMKTTALPLAILAATSQVAFSIQRGQEQPQDTPGLRHLGKADKDKVKCLKAKMSTSNNYEGDVKGTVKVCFNDALGADTGSFKLKASGLPELIAGGVHIHAGEFMLLFNLAL